MPIDPKFPEGLITMSELGVFAEVGELDESSNLYKLADLVIRTTGVMVRYAAQQPDWTVDNVPLEARTVALDFARRVFGNPQVQQRIQTGPLGESYSPDELTGLALKDSEEALLATFIDGEEGDLGSLAIISVVREDKLPPFDNRVWAPALGLGRNDYFIPMNGLGKYLGIE